MLICNTCGRIANDKPGGITQCNNPRLCKWIGTMADRDPLLEERQKTHGPFERNALISQQLKDIFYPNGRREEIRNDVHREALDMIALKLSRILSGQANFKDHWDDIAGYAKLASEACPKSQS